MHFILHIFIFQWQRWGTTSSVWNFRTKIDLFYWHLHLYSNEEKLFCTIELHDSYIWYNFDYKFNFSTKMTKGCVYHKTVNQIYFSNAKFGIENKWNQAEKELKCEFWFNFKKIEYKIQWVNKIIVTKCIFDLANLWLRRLFSCSQLFINWFTSWSNKIQKVQTKGH